METTGAADLLARFLVGTLAQGNPVAALIVVLIMTMVLSDVMNDAATAAILCPIALGIAATLGVNPQQRASYEQFAYGAGTYHWVT